ncbi:MULTISPECIES: hypothetical protein [unclassified Shewanella]|uniref:hypothetical protein n=1 Tax=unclassified Shewanella TaxID=196818 RepID=UPI001BBC0407|nr:MULTISPECIES: hypothetical protein [unclassified Shewanella]GIU08500.1 hypothetical protein TUM4444_09660 [Shewanella sp. MBTL60-112-B1]GIU38454.1 hypothetical protein TUM4445_32570 [Shewanella sp. MBTL60-112-B2]
MWELISFMLAFGVFMLIMHYWMDPKKLIEDIRSLKQSSDRIDLLEERVIELEKAVNAKKDDAPTLSKDKANDVR